MYKYDEAMDAFAADCYAIVSYIGDEGGCRTCLDLGYVPAGYDHQGKVYDPCPRCGDPDDEAEAEKAREARDAERQRVWRKDDWQLLQELRERHN